MKVHLYCLAWNEMPILPFFFRHYEGLVDHFFIYDDGSTDGTLEYLAKRSDVTVRSKVQTHADSYVLSSLSAHCENWKASRGAVDWVIVCDMDEFIHHADLAGYLRVQKAAGVTAIPSLGFQMVSRDAPRVGSDLARDMTMGAPWRNMSKLAVFDPNQITETGYEVGRHKASPTRNVVYPSRDELMLLHYKYLGLNRIKARHSATQARRRSTDLVRKWGHRNAMSDAELEADFAEFEARAVDVTRYRDIDAEHLEARWWRT